MIFIEYGMYKEGFVTEDKHTVVYNSPIFAPYIGKFDSELGWVIYFPSTPEADNWFSIYGRKLKELEDIQSKAIFSECLMNIWDEVVKSMRRRLKDREEEENYLVGLEFTIAFESSKYKGTVLVQHTKHNVMYTFTPSFVPFDNIDYKIDKVILDRESFGLKFNCRIRDKEYFNVTKLYDSVTDEDISLVPHVATDGFICLGYMTDEIKDVAMKNSDPIGLAYYVLDAVIGEMDNHPYFTWQEIKEFISDTINYRGRIIGE